MGGIFEQMHQGMSVLPKRHLFRVSFPGLRDWPVVLAIVVFVAVFE